METKVTDAVLPLLLESGSYENLTETLQVLLARGSLLTLVLFVGEASDRSTQSMQQTIKADLDDVEHLLTACLRKSDRVVRCGEAHCAAILMGTEVDGALRALHRFQRMLSCWKPLTITLRVGVAAAPEQAEDSQALVALALKTYLRILPVAEESGSPVWGEPVESKPALAMRLPGGADAQEKGGKASAHLKQVLALSTAAFSAEPGLRLLSNGESMLPVDTSARARARALGVPYIAPPKRIPHSVLGLLSVEMMRQLRCLPIGRDRNALTVALADPTDRGTVQRLEQLTGLTIFPVMTDPDALEALARPVRPRHTSKVVAPSASPSGN